MDPVGRTLQGRCAVSLALATTILALACGPAAAVAAVARRPPLAGRFSAPRLTGVYTPVAIDARGQVLSAAWLDKETLGVKMMRQDGSFTAPVKLNVPDVARSASAQFAFDDRGWIAVVVTYMDNAAPATGYHNEGCCLRVAATSWRMGARPPELQLLSDQLNAEYYFLGFSIAIGRSAWTLSWDVEGGVAGPDPLEEAYGPLGGRLQKARLALEGAGEFDLDVVQGRPIESWTSSGIHVATGSPAGRLTPLPGGQRIIPAKDFGLSGFVNDDEGDTVLWYKLEVKHRERDLMIATRAAGTSSFARPRVVATARGFPQVALAAGGGRTIVALWRRRGELKQLIARRGSVFGPFGATEVIGEHAREPRAFVDSAGRTVVLYEQPPAGLLSRPWSLMVATAEPGMPFSRPYRLGRFPHNCWLVPQGELLTSSSGYAIVPIRCGSDNRYVIHYAP